MKAIRAWVKNLIKTEWSLEACLLFHYVKMQLKSIIYEGDSPSSGTQFASIFILDFSASRNVKTKSILSTSYPDYVILL